MNHIISRMNGPVNQLVTDQDWLMRKRDHCSGEFQQKLIHMNSIVTQIGQQRTLLMQMTDPAAEIAGLRADCKRKNEALGRGNAGLSRAIAVMQRCIELRIPPSESDLQLAVNAIHDMQAAALADSADTTNAIQQRPTTGMAGMP